MVTLKSSSTLLFTSALSLTAIITVSTISLSSVTVSATSTTASVNVAEACSMNATVTTPHSATVPPNTYQADIGTTTLNVTCNDSGGFAIYAVGYTGDEIGGTNSTKLVGNTNSSSTISTGTATSGNTSNWAMKLATSGSSYVATLDNSFNNYHAVPTEYTKVAHYNSSTDAGSSATGSTLTTTYAAFITGTQGADTYTGKVKYTMVHPQNELVPHEIACDAGKICYNPNTNIVEGQMGQQTVSSSATSATLYAPNFKKTGYGFAGWSDKYDYETNPDAHFYGPNQDITFAAGEYTGSNPGLSLYAVWIKSAGTIQNWNGCSSLAQGATTALTDERDGNVYAVAKLADNKCWTIENLRLDDSAELSSTNTHNPSLPITNVYDATNPTTSNHLSATTDPTTTAWCQTNSSACDDQSMLATNNTTLFTNNTSSSYSAGSNVYSYGNYYNWYSATAGHGKYGSSYGSGYTAPGDICPAGWHLPTGGSASAEFGALDVAMGGTGGYQYTAEASNRWRTYPNNFIYSGSVGSSVNNRNSYGYYWSSSASTSTLAYHLYFYSGEVRPGTDHNNKYLGWMVRCVAGV